MAAKFLPSYLDDQINAYAAGKLSGAECERTLETVQYINDEFYIVEDELWYAEEYYDCLAASKQACAEAVASLEDGCYLEAACVFACVDQQDTEHYRNAKQYFGAEDALDWIDISFDQELINDSERIRQNVKAG